MKKILRMIAEMDYVPVAKKISRKVYRRKILGCPFREKRLMILGSRGYYGNYAENTIRLIDFTSLIHGLISTPHL